MAGLRGVDGEIIQARPKSTEPLTLTIYRRIILPLDAAGLLILSFVILAHLAIKSYDLIIALTGGGPGQATEMPATFMYSYSFTRNSMGIGAASAIIMMIMVFSIIIPYLYAEGRKESRE